MAAVEIRARDAVLCGSLESQLRLEDGFAVRPSDTMESVEEDLEVWVGAEEALDDVKVKDVLEHSNIVGSAVNDLDLEGAVGPGTNGGDVNVGDGSNLVRREGLGGFIDLVGDGLGGGPTISQVVLDAKIVLGAYMVMKLYISKRFMFGWSRMYEIRVLGITYHLGCDWR